MRMMLDGLPLETAEYSEAANIHFTVYTYGEESCGVLCDVLDVPERVLDLRRGGEHIPVRVCEHAIWPPCGRKYGDAMQRHNVLLEAVTPQAARSAAAAGR